MRAKSRQGKVIPTLAVLLLIGASFYYTCFRTTNEIGPIGADKDGRQIFLQSLDSYLAAPMGASMASEWEDTTFIGRLLVKEPMRTTIRIRFPSDHPGPDTAGLINLLEEPSLLFFSRFGTALDAEFWLREDHAVPYRQFASNLVDLDAITVEEMLAAMGFRRFQIYHAERRVLDRELPKIGQGNVKWAGDHGT